MRLIILVLCLFPIAFIVNAQEDKTQVIPEKPRKKKQQQVLTIESKITGSQEQPNVLYIMPWNGIKKPVVVQNNKMELSLPTFRPINPKVFKKEVRIFSANQNQAQQNMKQENNKK